MVADLVTPLVPAGRPRLVGIVNITSDSFSDGGRYLATEEALAHAWRLRSAGADVIELGPAASHPDAERVTPEEELRRLAGVIDPLVAAGVPVSVDSFLPETQAVAAARGAAYLNDIQGFPDPSRYAALAQTGCRLVVMHSVQRRGPATKVVTDPEEVWAGIERFFAERLAALQAAGISHQRLIIDPGLGFFLGSNPEPSVLALRRLGRLKARFGVPVLVSPSRKSFLRALTGSGLEGIGSATLAAELYAACQGVDFIRTHDVAALSDALTVLDALDLEREESPVGKREAVVAVVRRGERVLVIRRGPQARLPGYWAPPSGRLESGETQEAALVCEVREELGLRVTPRAKVWESPTDDGAFLLHWWTAEAETGEIVADPGEVGDVRWVTAQEFLTMEPVFAGDREFFARVLPGL